MRKMMNTFPNLIAMLLVCLLMPQALAGEDKPVLFPEAKDPVLGDRAAVVEWAWSPAYAKRFGLPAQEDGLKDGYLWLVGVKVIRAQTSDAQEYQCRIVGVIDNKAPMLTPAGDRFMQHPGSRWVGGLPTRYVGPALTEQNSFAPGQHAMYREPKNQAQRDRPHSGISLNYLLFHRYYTAELAYFELDGACRFLRDPELFRNEILFPTRMLKDKEWNPSVFESSALKFGIPDRVMRRMYPYILKAADWTTCLMERAGYQGIYADKQVKQRLGVSCVAIPNIKR